MPDEKGQIPTVTEGVVPVGPTDPTKPMFGSWIKPASSYFRQAKELRDWTSKVQESGEEYFAQPTRLPEKFRKPTFASTSLYHTSMAGEKKIQTAEQDDNIRRLVGYVASQVDRIHALEFVGNTIYHSPALIKKGLTFEEYVAHVKEKSPNLNLTEDDLAGAKQLYTMVQKDLKGGQPGELTPEELEKLGALTGGRKLPLITGGIRPASVSGFDQILGRVAAPPPLPKETTQVEMLDLYKKAGIDITKLMDEDEIEDEIKTLDSYWQERDKYITDLKTGAQAIKVPGFSVKDISLSLALSPLSPIFQIFDYLTRVVSDPITGMAYQAITKGDARFMLLPFGTVANTGRKVPLFTDPDDTGYTELYNEARDKGVSPYLAAGQAWRKAGMGWAWRVSLLPVDPINWPGTALMKPVRMLPLVGGSVGIIDDSIIRSTDEFFNATVKAMGRRIPPTTRQFVDIKAYIGAQLTKKFLSDASGGVPIRNIPITVARDNLKQAMRRTLDDPTSNNFYALAGRVLFYSRDIPTTQVEGFAREVGGIYTPAIKLNIDNILESTFKASPSKLLTTDTSASVLLTAVGAPVSEENVRIAAKLIKGLRDDAISSADSLLDSATSSGDIINRVFGRVQRTSWQNESSRMALKWETYGTIKSALSRDFYVATSFWRQHISPWIVTPFARSALVTAAYYPGNAFEGLMKLALEGYNPLGWVRRRGKVQVMLDNLLTKIDSPNTIQFNQQVIEGLTPEVTRNMIDPASRDLTRWRRILTAWGLGDQIFKRNAAIGTATRQYYYMRTLMKDFAEDNPELVGAMQATIEAAWRKRPPQTAEKLLSALNMSEDELFTTSLAYMMGGKDNITNMLSDIIGLRLLKGAKSQHNAFEDALSTTLIKKAVSKHPSAFYLLDDLVDKVSTGELYRHGPKSIRQYFDSARMGVWDHYTTTGGANTVMSQRMADAINGLQPEARGDVLEKLSHIDEFHQGQLQSITNMVDSYLGYDAAITKLPGYGKPELVRMRRQAAKNFTANMESAHKSAVNSFNQVMDPVLQSLRGDKLSIKWDAISWGRGITPAARIRFMGIADNLPIDIKSSLKGVIVDRKRCEDLTASIGQDVLAGFDATTGEIFVRSLSTIGKVESGEISANIILHEIAHSSSKNMVDELDIVFHNKLADLLHYENIIKEDILSEVNHIRITNPKYAQSPDQDLYYQAFVRQAKATKLTSPGRANQPDIEEWFATLYTRYVEHNKATLTLNEAKALNLIAQDVPVHIDIPEGWGTRVQPNFRRTPGWRAEVDDSTNQIVFESAKDAADPQVINHEVAHILLEKKTADAGAGIQSMAESKSQFLNDYARAVDEMDIHPNFVREHMAMDYGEYLSDPDAIKPEIRRILEKYMGERVPRAASKLDNALNIVNGKIDHLFRTSFPRRLSTGQFNEVEKRAIREMMDSWLREINFTYAQHVTLRKALDDIIEQQVRTATNEVEKSLAWDHYFSIRKAGIDDITTGIANLRADTIKTNSRANKILNPDSITSKSRPIIDSSGHRITRDDLASMHSLDPKLANLSLMQADSMLLKGKKNFLAETYAKAELMGLQANKTPEELGWGKEKITDLYSDMMISLGFDPDHARAIEPLLLDLKSLQNDVTQVYRTKALPKGLDKTLETFTRDVTEGAKTIPGYLDNTGNVSNDFYLRKQASADRASKSYYQVWSDQDNQNAVGALMTSIFPFWSYELHRWTWTPRQIIRTPGLFRWMGVYNNETDHGYIPIGQSDFEFNIGRNTIFMGMYNRMLRPDYPEFHDQFPEMSDALDKAGRIGFFPAPYIQFIKSMFGSSAGGRVTFGEAMPTVWKTPLNLYIAAHPTSALAKALTNNILADPYREYLTTEKANSLAQKQKLSFNGSHVRDKIKSGEKLSDQEQHLWEEAQRDIALESMVLDNSGVLRMKTEEKRTFRKQLMDLIEEITGVPVKTQVQINLKGKRLSDYVPLSPSDRKLLEQLEGYLYQRDSTLSLMPSSWQEEDRRRTEFFDEMEKLREQAKSSSITDIRGRSTPGFEELNRQWRVGEITVDQWKEGYKRLHEILTDSYTTTANQERYKDIPLTMEDITDASGNVIREGILTHIKSRGEDVPVQHPAKEILNKYYSLHPVESINPETGIREVDWDTYYAQVDQLTSAMSDTHRDEFYRLITDHMSDLEKTRWKIYRQFITPYNRIRQAIYLNRLNPDEQTLIDRYYTADPTQKEDLRNQVDDKGRKIISRFEAEVQNSRQNIRFHYPELDSWLNVFGVVSSFQTPAAETLYREKLHELGIAIRPE